MIIAPDAPGRPLIKESEWFGCYSGTWNQAPLIPEAYAHPAKVAYKLAERIVTHMLDQGYIEAGQCIIDPFAGVAGFAFHTMLAGINFVGVELEEKFVNLARQNIDLWQSRYGEWFNMGSGVVIQGDSRQLSEVISAADGVIASPPYADVVRTGEGTGARYDPIYHNGDNAFKKSSQAEYGRTAGNLGNMSSGGFDAVIGSPPFASQTPGTAKLSFTTRPDGSAFGAGRSMQNDYAEATVEVFNEYTYLSPEWIEHRKETAKKQNNIGMLPDEAKDPDYPTFWGEARKVVEQVYSVLRPGAYTAWTTGDYIRNGHRVEFGRQWMQLCEAVGFTAVEWITAWKVERNGTQLDLWGNGHSRDVERVSFFRRLANERNPKAAILNEDVIILRKPL